MEKPIPKIKKYETALQGRGDDMFQELADQLDSEAKKLAPLSPRVLHLWERLNGGYPFLVAIIVWE